MNFKRYLVISVLWLAVSANLSMAEVKGLDHYFKKPQYTGFQLSPNGKELAALAPVNDRMNIAIINLESGAARIVTGMTKQDVNGFMWATDSRPLFFMDKDGSESFGIFAVNADGSKLRTLAPPVDLQITNGQAVIRLTFVLDRLKDDPEHILVVSNQRRAEFPDVYRMDIMTGRKRMVQRNPGNVQGWFVGYDSNLIGASFTDDLYNGFMMLNEETGEWEELVRARYDEHTFQPVGIIGNGDTGYVSSRLTPEGEKRDKAAIYKYNFKTREMGELVFEHSRVDVVAVNATDTNRDIISVSYMVGKPETF